jgi:hypothetical protein
MLAICGNSCHELYKTFWYSFQKLLSPAKLNQNWLGSLGPFRLHSLSKMAAITKNCHIVCILRWEMIYSVFDNHLLDIFLFFVKYLIIPIFSLLFKHLCLKKDLVIKNVFVLYIHVYIMFILLFFYCKLLNIISQYRC